MFKSCCGVGAFLKSDEEDPESTTGSQSLPQMKHSSLDPSIKLHNHQYVVCISGRVEDYAEFPFEGREDILYQTLYSISKGDSVLLVGEPGIGKKTISLGLARMLDAFKKSNPSDQVYSRTVYTLTLGHSFQNSAIGEHATQIQENIREVFRLVEQVGPEKLVLCIDDLDVLNFIDRRVKESTSSEMAKTGEIVRDITDPSISTENMLRFMLFNRRVICLCTCLESAYERLRRSDTYYDEKFSESFRVLRMKPPSVSQSVRMIYAHKVRLQSRYACTITNEAIDASILYAVKYISHRPLPEKALDVLIESCKAAKQGNDNSASSSNTVLPQVEVQQQNVSQIVKKWCGVNDSQLQECLDAGTRWGFMPKKS